MLKCFCSEWGIGQGYDFVQYFSGNGHHPRCPRYKADGFSHELVALCEKYGVKIGYDFPDDYGNFYVKVKLA